MSFHAVDYDNAIGKKAKARKQVKQAAKKQVKQEHKLQRMDKRTDRRKTVQDRKQAVGVKQAEAVTQPLPPVQADPSQGNFPEPLPPVANPKTGQGMTAIEPSTPAGTGATTQQPGGGGSSGGGGGDTSGSIPQDEWNQAQQETQQEEKGRQIGHTSCPCERNSVCLLFSNERR